MVLSRWPYPPGRERATLSRCLTSSGVRYSRGRTAALVGRRGVIVRFLMVGPFLRFTRKCKFDRYLGSPALSVQLTPGESGQGLEVPRFADFAHRPGLEPAAGEEPAPNFLLSQ